MGACEQAALINMVIVETIVDKNVMMFTSVAILKINLILTSNIVIIIILFYIISILLQIVTCYFELVPVNKYQYIHTSIVIVNIIIISFLGSSLLLLSILFSLCHCNTLLVWVRVG